MAINYANQIINKPVLLKKNIKASKAPRLLEDTRTRNQNTGIYQTNEIVPHQLMNESYLMLKSTDNKKIKRIKKKRSSISNSHSKTKHTKSTTEYITKPKEKTSSR